MWPQLKCLLVLLVSGLVFSVAPPASFARSVSPPAAIDLLSPLAPRCLGGNNASEAKAAYCQEFLLAKKVRDNIILAAKTVYVTAVYHAEVLYRLSVYTGKDEVQAKKVFTDVKTKASLKFASVADPATAKFSERASRAFARFVVVVNMEPIWRNTMGNAGAYASFSEALVVFVSAANAGFVVQPGTTRITAEFGNFVCSITVRRAVVPRFSQVSCTSIS